MIEDLTLAKAVDFAVETEKWGQRFYERLAKRFGDDAELSGMFAKLADDEQHHAKRFGALRAAAAAKGEPLAYEQQQFLRAVSLSDIFGGDTGLGKKLDEIETREDALGRAFDLEKTTLLYYQAMKEVLDDPLVDELIAEEKGHLVKVMQYMVTGAEMRGLGDKF